jgi:hypothetical protein
VRAVKKRESFVMFFIIIIIIIKKKKRIFGRHGNAENLCSSIPYQHPKYFIEIEAIIKLNQ